MPGTLRVGSRGIEVAQLQIRLNMQIEVQPELQVDEIFGLRTQQAVITVQRHVG